MADTIIFKTKSGAPYLHSAKINQFLLCHPLLHFLLDLREQGVDIKHWLDNREGKLVEIENYGTVSRQELDYYYKKYLLLSENGYFDGVDNKKKITGRLNAVTVKSCLANTLQLTFEVTDRCNLACKYCGYGELYKDYDERTGKNLSIDAAQNIVDYLQELWDSPLNQSHGKDINVGFYGGEPLLNVPFISQIMDVLNNLKLKHNRFAYSMTTNGVLLEKHMDFLVENDVKLLISLDGGEEANGYRVFSSGTPAFNAIYQNILTLRDKYPAFFEKKVEFNSVLHSKNSISHIHKFFKENFDKVPTINEVSTTGVAPERIKEFLATYKNFNESLNQAEDYSTLEKDLFIRLPDPKETVETLFQYSGYVFRKYDDLIFSKENDYFIPTGTCLPFSRKIFVTVNGKLLPCERISQKFGLGSVDKDGMVLDCEEVARTYNDYYDKLNAQCKACNRIYNCKQCIFYLDIQGSNPVCKGLMNRRDFAGFLSARLSYLEEHPGLYAKAMKEITVI